jgi:WD40 repeat protein
MAGSLSSGSDLAFKSSQTIHTEHLKTVRAVAWSPAGKTLATASFDSNVGIWEQERDDDADEDGGEDGEAGLGNGEWECIGTLEGHETECKSVAYSASGTLLASCSRDKSVWIWEGALRVVLDGSVFGAYSDNLTSQCNPMQSSSAWAFCLNTRKT